MQRTDLTFSPALKKLMDQVRKKVTIRCINRQRFAEEMQILREIFNSGWQQNWGFVPFTYQLQMGDQIEIITQKQPNPSRDWLNPNLGYVTTSRGRSKIHAWFRKQDRDKNILAGRQILDDELEHLGISLKDAEKHLLPRYNFNEQDELLAAIGGGDIRLNQMVNFLQAQFNKPSAAEQDAAALKQLQQKTHAPQNRSKDNGRVVVEGVGNLMHHIARCCQPIPGDEIVGFITQGRGIVGLHAYHQRVARRVALSPHRVNDALRGVRLCC